MVKCEGLLRRVEVNGEILTRIFEGCPKLKLLDITLKNMATLEVHGMLALEIRKNLLMKRVNRGYNKLPDGMR
jgi:hypothetical protein